MGLFSFISALNVVIKSPDTLVSMDTRVSRDFIEILTPICRSKVDSQ